MLDSAALSVLVLAWNEDAPAVRTVIEAAPAVGSLLVLLPPAAPTEPAPAPTPATAEPPASEQPDASEQLAATSAVATEAPAASPPLADASALAAPALPTEPAEPEAAAALTATVVPVAPAATEHAKPPTAEAEAPAAVRVLHLPAALPPSHPRASSALVPAAPYLGATPRLGTEGLVSSAAPETDFTFGISPPATAPSPTVSTPLAANAALASAATTTPVAPAVTAPEAAPGTNAAPDSAPTAEALATADTAPPEEAKVPLADMAFRADEIVDPDPMQELQAALPEQPAATPADAPALSDLPPAPRYGPFGLRLPELATEPAMPAAPAADTSDELENDSLAEELPAPPAPQYPAPNLNAQIIHYARQAVPTALASGPFEVLYAPAWPTWLAAIELRQRSGRPLVLYLPALEAGRQQADTAAGWPAEIQRQALRQADLVLVDTHALARRLRRELGLAPSAVRVLPGHDAAAIARALRRAHRR